ncbi:uncharacterized protein KY384_005139 [Bacidia gigantensis]|uniref:uncharacterized protein n=1 Tax=Bacidia gigantensis TaxID=2732470 RepID=UPI001D03FF65|nr:uncharacterized protein KY384_005139 [Bacidia gigantensis]KAG8529658.1 hypothetical protein KY384_005139 [Bacidia gigantensis]
MSSFAGATPTGEEMEAGHIQFPRVDVQTPATARCAPFIIAVLNNYCLDDFVAQILTNLTRTPCEFYPHNSGARMQLAYASVERNLLSHSDGDNFSKSLVDETLNYLNEIYYMQKFAKQRADFFDRSIADCKSIIERSKPRGCYPNTNRLIERMNIYEDIIKRLEESKLLNQNQFKSLPTLEKDVGRGLDLLFKKRTLEQNDLALKANLNNKAILVFTIIEAMETYLAAYADPYQYSARL